jgi:spermidine synthase
VRSDYPPPPAARRLPPVAAAILTFLAAAFVLVLEIAAGRLLAPYVGVTLQTWTGIIGVILAGIAVGAWAGGRLADRFGPERLLGPTLMLGGLAAMSSVPIVGFVGAGVHGNDVPSIAILAAAGFFLPAAVLSAVGPMIVRASITDVRSSGTLVGRLSAIGTAGAIIGTFATGFFLLGAVPPRLLILGTGAGVAVLGLVTGARLSGSRGWLAAALFLAAAAAGATVTTAAALANPCQRESRNYCISVMVDRDFPAGRILVLDDLWHSFVDLEEPTRLQFGYIRWFAAAAAPIVSDRGGELEALHVGGGGFSFPRYLQAVAPGSRHTILELDPEVLRVGREELGLVPDDRLKVVLGDARISIERMPTDGFDLVVGDAFGGLSVPWHLTTQEFIDEVQRVMRPGGRYVMNVIDHPSLQLVRAETATLRTRFEHVVVIGLPFVLEDGPFGGNLVLVASNVPIDVAALRRTSEALGEAMGDVSGPAALDAFVEGSPVLTDDFAPVDQLLWR